MGFVLVRLGVIMGVMSLSFPVVAKENVSAKKEKIKKVDLKNQNVNGMIKAPSTSLVISEDANNENGLLRLRENFEDRMDQDTGSHEK